MKLYRGYTSRPKIYIENIAKERDELEEVLKQGPTGESIVDVIGRIGAETFNRLHELRVIAGPQFFTDQEQPARDFAGKDGFLITLDVPDEVAQAHYQGEHMMSPGSEMVVNSNFVFRGSEIAEHLNDWNVELVEVFRENDEVCGKLNARTIRGEEDLSEADKESVRSLRDNFKLR